MHINLQIIFLIVDVSFILSQILGENPHIRSVLYVADLLGSFPRSPTAALSPSVHGDHNRCRDCCRSFSRRGSDLSSPDMRMF